MRAHLFALIAVFALALPAFAGELDKEFKGGDVPKATPALVTTSVTGSELDKESPTQAWRRGGWGYGGGWGRGWGYGGGWGHGWGHHYGWGHAGWYRPYYGYASWGWPSYSYYAPTYYYPTVSYYYPTVSYYYPSYVYPSYIYGW